MLPLLHGNAVAALMERTDKRPIKEDPGFGRLSDKASETTLVRLALRQ
jgi:hypothetical protein